MTCPDCGAENQTGKFCSECGSSLGGACSECGAEVPPGARYCTTCGAPVGAAAEEPGETASGGGGGSRVAWIMGAAAVIVVLLVLFLPDDTEPVRPAGGNTGAPFTGTTGGAGGGMGAGGMGGLSADMRTNADRLFNRIMMAAEQGNEAEIAQFMPMAIQAYGMVEDLDTDGRYHLAVLELTAGEYDAARATAQQILDTSPNHILALGVAAEAAEARGDTGEATALWNRLLEAYPQESGKALPEYMDHQAMLEQYRSDAEEATS